ncbi:MAG: sulfotransferase [Bacteroidaceae bacterium]|nr:sulfotransferase [Bacteroidaceae bacterium]
MGLIKFEDLPINPLVGADWATFKKMTAGEPIDPGYRGKFYLTKAICRLLSTAAPIQERRYRKLLADQPLEHDPLFILGHWRSGTTFVHNIFAQDHHFGHTTTYQTVFPHLMMFGQGFLKPIMKFFMPSSRPTDGMELTPDTPQEEEFALNNTMPYSYYDFWYFPKRMLDYCDRWLTFENITPEEEQAYKEAFLRCVKISLWNTGGTQYLSKNPPHTGHVRALVEMFPNAKFIYLMRNPYTVFESTRSFFTQTIAPLKLQNVSDDQIEQNAIEVYPRLYRAYQEQKHFIPEGNLYEVRFEDFERDAYAVTKDIYARLQLPGWEESEPAIRAYIESKRGYKKNRYDYKPRTIQLVNQHWAQAIDDWGYERPAAAMDKG